MNPDQFQHFAHNAVHDLQRLNATGEEEFHLSYWPRWDYDSEAGTWTLPKDGLPKVIASIQVLGSTSVASGTWLWSWANETMPKGVTGRMKAVQAFGQAENLELLTQASAPDNETLGWKLTAIAVPSWSGSAS